MNNGYLPKLTYSDGMRKTVNVRFGGYNHTMGCTDSQIYNSVNMSADALPLLSTRERRSRALTSYAVGAVKNVCAYDSLYYFSQGGALYRFSEDGKDALVNSSSRVTSKPADTYCAAFGSDLFFAPDMVYIDKDGKSKPMAVSVPCEDGKYCEIVSYAYRNEMGAPTLPPNVLSRIKNCDIIRYQKAGHYDALRVGDGVTLKGGNNPAYNKTLVIRDMFNYDGYSYLCFDSKSLLMNGNQTLEIVRDVPSLDFIFECGNRLWGCSGDRVYASKAGDPFNWNVFDGTADDSFAVSAGSAGNFTAACSYLGYPTFFKEDVIYKVYGSTPSAFKLVENACVGVKEGSGKSLAVAGETLFYHSRIGVMAYTGAVPANISEPLGKIKYKNAIGGSDGVRYYISLTSEEDKSSHLFVYDADKKVWSRYDDLEVSAFAFCRGSLYALTEQGDIWSMSQRDGVSFEGEEQLEFLCEFGDFTYEEPNRKCMSKLQIRLEADEDSMVKIYINYDSERDSRGNRIWEKISEISSCVKQSRYIPLVPRRCDHFRLKFEGEGAWTLYSLAKEYYIGSEM